MKNGRGVKSMLSLCPRGSGCVRLHKAPETCPKVTMWDQRGLCGKSVRDVPQFSLRVPSHTISLGIAFPHGLL